MNRKYRVCVVAEVSANAYITVTAESEDDAIDTAVQDAKELDFEDWELGQLGRIEHDHCEEVEE